MPRTELQTDLAVLSNLSRSRDGFREFFLTAATEEPVDVAWALGAYEAIAAAVVEQGIQPIAEKIYGTIRGRDRVLANRRAVLRDHDLADTVPVTFVEGCHPAGGEIAGIQVWGIAARGDRHRVRTVPGGRLWQAPGFRLLHLAGVSDPGGDGFSREAKGMFAGAAAAAAEQDFDYGQTVRTWIYVDRLLECYDELNRVRTEFYRHFSFRYPASTGIQGRGVRGSCLMDVLLVDGLPTRLLDHSPRQGPAFGYGSAFSRAVAIDHRGGRTVHVSGTASIDVDGTSLHPGDPEAQFLETLLNVAAVLQACDLSLSDIVQATLFCKDTTTYQACLRAGSLLNLRRFPTVHVLADVCRPDLLVEMEAIASV